MNGCYAKKKKPDPRRITVVSFVPDGYNGKHSRQAEQESHSNKKLCTNSSHDSPTVSWTPDGRTDKWIHQKPQSHVFSSQMWYWMAASMRRHPGGVISSLKIKSVPHTLLRYLFALLCSAGVGFVNHVLFCFLDTNHWSVCFLCTVIMTSSLLNLLHVHVLYQAEW